MSNKNHQNTKSAKYQPGEILEVVVEKIIPKGLGLAHADGLTIFVPLSAAGDRVRVRLGRIKGSIAQAEIEEVLEPSPDRITPPCPYFGRCGGCDFQQMNYEAQLAAKVGIIRDCLHRIGKIDWDAELPIVPSPQEFRYRSRAQWHIDRHRRRIGYFRRGTRDVIDIEQCPKLVDSLNVALADLRQNIEWENLWSDLSAVEAAAGDNGEVSVYSADALQPTHDITFTASGEEFSYSAQCFFQGNQYLVDSLVDAAIGGASGGMALDLYSGVGLFALPLARRFETVIGVEDNQRAVDYANRNAAKAGLGNLNFVTESVRTYLRLADRGPVDFILLDPPRAGAENDTIRNLIALSAPQISYVSCEPSILARDLRVFLAAGYAIDSITAFDLFPQTHHVETVVRMSLK